MVVHGFSSEDSYCLMNTSRVYHFEWMTTLIEVCRYTDTKKTHFQLWHKFELLFLLFKALIRWGRFFSRWNTKLPEQTEQEVNKHQYHPGCCATQMLRTTWKTQISICHLIGGNKEDNDIENNRQEEVGSGFSACCWRKWWEANSETEDEGTWCPIREDRVHVVQKLHLNSASLKDHFCTREYVQHAASQIQSAVQTPSCCHQTGVALKLH